MYNFNVDRERKILFIEFSEYIDNSEALEASHEFKEILKKDIKNYIVVCDIGKLKSSTRAARLLLQDYMRKLCNLPPKKIIRIVEQYNGALLFDRAYSLSNSNYRVTKVSSAKKAMEIVDTIDEIPPVFQNFPCSN